MAIALASITAPDLLTQTLALAAVAVLITVGVYGAVALIVKADDVGLRLAQRAGPLSGPFGRGLVRAMPTLLAALSFVGMLAMLWVGGGILVHGFAGYGMSGPEHAIQVASETVGRSVPLGSTALAWLVSVSGSGIVGLIAGALTWSVVRVASPG